MYFIYFLITKTYPFIELKQLKIGENLIMIFFSQIHVGQTYWYP